MSILKIAAALYNHDQEDFVEAFQQHHALHNTLIDKISTLNFCLQSIEGIGNQEPLTQSTLERINMTICFILATRQINIHDILLAAVFSHRIKVVDLLLAQQHYVTPQQYTSFQQRLWRGSVNQQHYEEFFARQQAYQYLHTLKNHE